MRRNLIVCFPGRSGEATAGEMKELLGIPATHPIPPQGVDHRLVAGFTVYVRPLSADSSSRRRRFALRVRAICPYCGRDVAASRLRQHIVTHPDELEADNAPTWEDFSRD